MNPFLDVVVAATLLRYTEIFESLYVLSVRSPSTRCLDVLALVHVIHGFSGTVCCLSHLRWIISIIRERRHRHPGYARARKFW